MCRLTCPAAATAASGVPAYPVVTNDSCAASTICRRVALACESRSGLAYWRGAAGIAAP